MDLHVKRFPESESRIFSVLSEYMCVSVCVISITQKQNTAETQILNSTFKSYVDAT